MSNIHDCIQRAVDAKDLNPVRGRSAQDQLAQLVERYRSVMSDDQARIAAGADLKEATRRAARSRYHAVINQLQAMRQLKATIENAPTPDRALRYLMEWSENEGFAGESVKSLTDAYHTSIAAGLYEMLNKVGLNVISNSRDPILLENLIDELHGIATGNVDAARLADAVRYQQKRMRQLFNAHGGDIGELADYGVPHAHSADVLRQRGFDAWANTIEGHLAWDKIIDLGTGKPFADAAGGIPDRAQTERFLREVYDNITTRGWNTRDPSMTTGGQALYNQRADHRVLHFKSGKDWLAYNNEFGAADPFSAMMNGLFGLANDVAMMRVLGPNPRAGLEFAIQVAMKRAAELRDPKLEKAVHAQASLARTMFNHQSGAASIPENVAWANFFSGVRAFNVSTQLGSAVLSSASDMVTIGLAARHIGMNPANVAARTTQLIASSATRAEAARMGYVAATLADAGAGQARYFGKLLGTGITNRMASATLRMSGLNFLTDMRRVSFQMEFSGYMAQNADRAFGDIDPSLHRVLSERGITARDWDFLRASETRFVSQAGADFVAPHYWLETQTAMPRMEAEGLAMRLQMITQEQLEMAVPTASLEGRARMLGDTKGGSVTGELARSAATYRSFAVSLTMNQYRRWLYKKHGLGKLGYIFALGAGLTLMGALTIQLKEIAKGNDPRPMWNRKFLYAAMLQGGGLGIFGDFFFSEASRTGGGFAEAASGATIGSLGTVIRLAASPIGSYAEGKDFNPGRMVTDFARYNVPVLGSNPLTRAVIQRGIMDTLQQYLDDEAEGTWRRQDRKRERDYGNEAYLGRGLDGNRLPDLTNILGETR